MCCHILLEQKPPSQTDDMEAIWKVMSLETVSLL